MIERLLAADSALGRDDLDVAERLFNQVAEADGRNAIAVVGLGQVAARRGDARAARGHFLRALEIDPDDAAATRLLAELDASTTDRLPVEPVAPMPAAAQPGTPAVTATRPSIWQRIRRWLGRNRGTA